MRFLTRTSLILTMVLLLTAAGRMVAQPAEAPAGTTTATATDTAAPAETSTTADEQRRMSSDELRNRFTSTLQQHPPELGTILKLDPTLLSDEAFLARYPELKAFVARHPQIRHHSRYYLAQVDLPPAPRNAFDEFMESLMVFLTFLLIAFALAWLVRTIIEQKRWSRLARTQTEVHNKILDRFGSSDELLQYIKTPAGTKFLESAPIPLHAEKPVNPSLSRVLWSIQIGVVVATGALGMLVVSGRFEKDTAQGMFAMGVIGFCVGLGFIASAVVSIVLSPKLSAWQRSESAPLTQFDDPGVMR